MSLTVEQQGDAECMLATIAALAERPLTEVRARAFIACGADWPSIVLKSDYNRFWKIVGKLKREFKVTGIPTSRTFRQAARLAQRGLYAPTGSARELPAVGRGSVTFAVAGGQNHICPFENGLLVDPNYPDSTYTLDQFLDRPDVLRLLTITMEKSRKTRVNLRRD